MDNLPPFNDGCFCYRPEEADAARAAGQEVKCAPGLPCSCMMHFEFDAAADPLFGADNDIDALAAPTWDPLSASPCHPPGTPGCTGSCFDTSPGGASASANANTNANSPGSGCGCGCASESGSGSCGCSSGYGSGCGCSSRRESAPACSIDCGSNAPAKRPSSQHERELRMGASSCGCKKLHALDAKRKRCCGDSCTCDSGCVCPTTSGIKCCDDDVDLLISLRRANAAASKSGVTIKPRCSPPRPPLPLSLPRVAPAPPPAPPPTLLAHQNLHTHVGGHADAHSKAHYGHELVNVSSDGGPLPQGVLWEYKPCCTTHAAAAHAMYSATPLIPPLPVALTPDLPLHCGQPVASGAHVCALCGEMFRNQDQLETHSAKVHKAARPYKCNQCNASFLFKQNRDRHIVEVHQGKRPHKCPHPNCNAAFKNSSGLKQHLRTVHDKQRPFKCPHCPSSFGQRNHLTQHILVVHEKRKLFKCDVCGSSFSNRGNLNQHRRRKHPDIALKAGTKSQPKPSAQANNNHT